VVAKGRVRAVLLAGLVEVVALVEAVPPQIVVALETPLQ
jgi:hypothetical protein